MTRSTELTHRRAQGDPEFIEWVRVMVRIRLSDWRISHRF